MDRQAALAPNLSWRGRFIDKSPTDWEMRIYSLRIPQSDGPG